MDGKPRLVRGVAGSGKTVVLAHWLQKTVKRLAGKSDCMVWGVYANRSLARLITDTIEEAWAAENNGRAFPWNNRVTLWHVKDILEHLLPEVDLSLRPFEFDYDRASEEYLKRKPVKQIAPRCHALFIDEAQDMGPSTLKLLSALVEQADPNDPKSRSINIFYDNAQNVYGRGTPKWSEIGLDLRGRSTVMKESFRSTVPITEFALNVLYKLQPPDADADHKELVDRGLIERTQRNGTEWWHVRFNQVDGPPPVYKRYASLDKQVSAIAEQVFRWVKEEGVRPRDICILSNDKSHGERIAEETSGLLNRIGARAVFQAGQAFDSEDGTVIVSTTQSFKGYEAEVVVIGGVERFIGSKKILANNLYVAMTRARSILAVFAYDKKGAKPEAARILSVVEKCLDGVLERPKVEGISNLDDFEDVLSGVGSNHRDWLARLWKSRWVEREPIVTREGEILAEPLFWFKEDDRTVACFRDGSPGTNTLHRLEDAGVLIIRPGQEWSGG
jgi:superfamily I DNA and RNA helicase